MALKWDKWKHHVQWEELIATVKSTSLVSVYTAALNSCTANVLIAHYGPLLCAAYDSLHIIGHAVANVVPYHRVCIYN